MKYTNCLECPNHRSIGDGEGLDGETKIYCCLLDEYIRSTKTRWLENDYSYINTPSDCPLEDINEINED